MFIVRGKLCAYSEVPYKKGGGGLVNYIFVFGATYMCPDPPHSPPLPVYSGPQPLMKKRGGGFKKKSAPCAVSPVQVVYARKTVLKCPKVRLNHSRTNHVKKCLKEKRIISM